MTSIRIAMFVTALLLAGVSSCSSFCPESCAERNYSGPALSDDEVAYLFSAELSEDLSLAGHIVSESTAGVLDVTIPDGPTAFQRLIRCCRPLRELLPGTYEVRFTVKERHTHSYGKSGSTAHTKLYGPYECSLATEAGHIYALELSKKGRGRERLLFLTWWSDYCWEIEAKDVTSCGRYREAVRTQLD